jgi:ubiquinone/menaquinone biosynthesis C-methylase UbiE
MTQKNVDIIDSIYDPRFRAKAHVRFFDESGFSNFGYWLPSTRNGVEACNNLVDKLLEPIGEKRGTILDVACGQGGTTKRLTEYFEPANVTAINISEHQIERAQANVPGCRFLVMNATELGFADASFDNLICVEAAFHFDTREQFLREAFRVLKPGGWLVLSDILLKKPPKVADYPVANFLHEVEYRELLERLGFDHVQMREALRQTYYPFYKKYSMVAAKEYFNVRRWPRVFLEEEFLLKTLGRFLLWRIAYRSYPLVSAQKPLPQPAV